MAIKMRIGGTRALAHSIRFHGSPTVGLPCFVIDPSTELALRCASVIRCCARNANVSPWKPGGLGGELGYGHESKPWCPNGTLK